MCGSERTNWDQRVEAAHPPPACSTSAALTAEVEVGQVKVPGNPAHRWGPETQWDYFLLAAHHDCLWKINQCFGAPLRFILAVTHHINKLKLLDAPPHLQAVPARQTLTSIKAPFDQSRSVFTVTQKAMIVLRLRDRFSCFLHISEVMGEQSITLVSAQSAAPTLKLHPGFIPHPHSGSLQTFHLSESRLRVTCCPRLYLGPECWKNEANGGREPPLNSSASINTSSPPVGTFALDILSLKSSVNNSRPQIICQHGTAAKHVYREINSTINKAKPGAHLWSQVRLESL